MNGEKIGNFASVKSLDKSLRQTQVGNVKLVIWAGGFVIQSVARRKKSLRGNRPTIYVSLLLLLELFRWESPPSI